MSNLSWGNFFRIPTGRQKSFSRLLSIIYVRVSIDYYLRHNSV